MEMKYRNTSVCLLFILVWGCSLQRVSALMQEPIAAAIKSADSAHATRPEEILIRTTYAKLSYADEVRILLDAVRAVDRDRLWATKADLVDAALYDRLNVQLSDFQFGRISDIATRRIADFDGSPSAIGGEVLQITPSIFNYSAGNAPSKYVAYAKFTWIPSRTQTLPEAESWPVAKVLQDEQFEGKVYSNYVTYTVAVTFAGKSRTYNAWMLFGADEQGRQQIYFMDPVIDSTGVLFAAEHSLYPDALAETDLMTVPFVNRWLYNSARSCTAPHNDKDNRADVCCDEQSGRCGASRSFLLSHDFHRVFPRPRRRTQPLPASFRISTPDLHPLLQSSGCTNSSQTLSNFQFNQLEHTSGEHSLTSSATVSCQYTSVGPGLPCSVSCNVKMGALNQGEFGKTGSRYHAIAASQADGSNNSDGPQVSCNGIAAMAVKSCPVTCSITISINPGVGGSPASINFPANDLWNASWPVGQTCRSESSPCNAFVPLSGQIDPLVACNPGGGGTSPIIIDTEGEGFHLTSADAGVTFDMSGAGHPFQIAWTDAHYHNAFLALPGADGLIHNGKELFGNFTPQPPSNNPNGFIALAQYDKRENGGNEDGIIDERDEVFSRLRLWIDENHDGICQPGELHRLPELGVYSLALNYNESRRTDQFGNQFRYKARVNPGERRDPRDETPSGEPGRWTYDIFFVTK